MDSGQFRDVVTVRRLAVLGALAFGALVPLVFQALRPFTLLPTGIAVGFGVYAVLGTEPDARVPDISRRDLSTGLAAVALLTIGAAIVSLTNAYYNKPVPFYLFMTTAAGAILLRTFYFGSQRTNAALAWVYAGVSFVSIQIAFPLGVKGPDQGVHVEVAQTIIETGHIGGHSVYNQFPGQHLVTATFVEFAGPWVPTQTMYSVLGVSLMLLGVAVTYLVGSKLADERTGVLAMLLVATMDYVVYRASHPSKLAYALPLFLFVVVATLYAREERTTGASVLFLLFSTALIFTHHYTGMIAAVFLATLAVGQRLLPSLVPSLPLGQRAHRAATSRLALLFVLAFLTYFLFYSGFFDTVAKSVLGAIASILFGSDTSSVKSANRLALVPTRLILINTIGSATLFTFVVLGVLRVLRRVETRWLLLTGWLVSLGVMLVLGVIVNIPFLLPQRVYVVAQMSAFTFFAAVGLVYLYRHVAVRTDSLRVAGTAVLALFVVFAFFSTTSVIAGMETSPFNDQIPHPLWYERTERQAALDSTGTEVQDIYWAHKYTTENGSANYGPVPDGAFVGTDVESLESGVRTNPGYGQFGTASYVFPTDPTRGLDRSHRVYDNGPIVLYVKRTPSVGSVNRTR